MSYESIQIHDEVINKGKRDETSKNTQSREYEAFPCNFIHPNK